MHEAAALCVHCGLPVPAARRRGSVQAGEFCCFGCRIAHGLARPAASAPGPQAGGTLLLRLGLGIFLSINIMAFSWVSYAQELFGPAGAAHGPLASLFAYLLMFLCAVVVVLLGLPLVADALDGRVNANLLISVGVGAAYLLSVTHTLRGAGSLYYDTAAMVLVLVTLGNYLEAEAKRRAARSGEALFPVVSRSAWIEHDGHVVERDLESLAVGDTVRVRAGETIPVDGSIAEGSSRVDESSLTGESNPRPVSPGESVLAGSVSLDGLLRVRARAVGADRVIERTRRLLEEARLQPPPIQRLADRVARVFVPGVILLALGLFARHAWNGDAAAGLFVALSVLLISCPCALGLAAPLATWNALRRAASRGILIDSAVTLERAAAVDRLFFDKTGTLTESDPALDGIVTVPGFTETEALARAAALETASLHPFARSIVAAAHDRELRLGRPEATRALPGLGIEARIDGRAYWLGNRRLAARRGATAREPLCRPEESGLAVYLGSGTRVLARFELTETLRSDARWVLTELQQMRVTASVLTGDRSGPALRLSHELGVHVEAGLVPEEKLRHIERARGAGHRVAMVGDGVNDAPVLAAADVGIAIGSATDLARQAGNVRLLSNRLDRVPHLLALARHCLGRIRLNLIWAFAYNAVGLPLAATGLLSPVFSAMAMIASSLTIVALSRGAGVVHGVHAEGSPHVETPSAAEATA